MVATVMVMIITTKSTQWEITFHLNSLNK